MPLTLTPAQIEHHARAVIAMVATDITEMVRESVKLAHAGQSVPQRDIDRMYTLITARSFTDPHDAVDANDYLAGVPWAPDDYADVNAVTERVSELLADSKHIEVLAPLT